MLSDEDIRASIARAKRAMAEDPDLIHKGRHELFDRDSRFPKDLFDDVCGPNGWASCPLTNRKDDESD